VRRRWPGLRSAARGSFGRSVLQLTSGTAAGQVIGIAVTPVLTRLFAPEDFGTFAVYTTMVGLLVVVGTLRYELAVPLARTATDAAALVRGAFAVLGVFSALVALAVALPATRDLAPSLSGVHWLLVPVGLLATGSYSLVAATAVRDQRFAALGRRQVWQAVVRAAVQVGTGLAGLTRTGLVLGHVVGSAAGTASLLRSSEIARTAARLREPLRPLAVLKQFRKYPLYSMPAGLLNSTALQVPVILLASGYGVGFVGQYALAQRVIAAPLTLVASSIASVYRARLSQMLRSGTGDVLALYTRLVGLLAVVGLVPLAGLAALAPSLFELVFGPEWDEAGRIVRLLGLMFFAKFVFSSVAEALNALQRQGRQLVWDLGRTASVVAVLVVGPLSGAEAETTVLLYAVTMTAWYAFHGVLVRRALKAHAGVPSRPTA
jgi:O-antigen/teichoic acid export membrane protein